MKHIPTFFSTEEIHDGQPGRLYRYLNGYGASIVWTAREGWNLAVVRFFDLDGDGDPNLVYRWDGRSDLLQLDFGTSITPDVIRLSGLDDPDLIATLDKIAALEGKQS